MASAKVGTDGVLLGAWSRIPTKCQKILDIGTGTGLIALMLAQRTKSLKPEITGIEIEKKAFIESKLNFNNSPWADRLFCKNIDFKSFEPIYKFDLIVCNPPFYTSTQQSKIKGRALARNNEFLPFYTLFHNVDKVLKNMGIFNIIVPFSEEDNIFYLAKQTGLFPNKITRIKGNFNVLYKRSLICFSKTKTPIYTNELVIEHSRNVYTQDYIELTKEFYLNF